MKSVCKAGRSHADANEDHGLHAYDQTMRNHGNRDRLPLACLNRQNFNPLFTSLVPLFPFLHVYL